MSYKENVVEDALFQIRNLEETLQENAKGILQSTMSEEIKQLVKESLKEQEEIDMPPADEDEMAMDDMGMEDEDEMEMDDMDMEDEDEMGMEDMGIEDEDEMEDEDEFSMDDEEAIDMTDASDEEVLKVFRAMGDEDGIVVKKDGDFIHLTDEEDDYLIQLGESYGDLDEEEEEDDEEMEEMEELDEMEDEMSGEETIYEIEMDEFSFDDEEEEEEFTMDEPRGMGRRHHRMEKGMDEPRRMSRRDREMEEGMDMYADSMEEEEDMEEGMDMYSDSMEEQIYEAIKKSIKPKGVGIGSGPKFNYDKKPNQSLPVKKQKEAFGKGTKAMGTGKAKFEYKEGATVKKDTPVKKVETKEASRTYGNGSKDGSRGLRKGRMNNRNYEYNPFKISESRSNEEVQLLKEKNEEYKQALDVFRTKLNEVAVFNSNLAYATRLFTEHSTTKQEKINILRRFDNIESLKESKNLYRTVKGELSTTGSVGEQKITESIERTVNKTGETGSAVNLIESKTYENPQFLRMKDLMGKLK